MSRHLVTGVAGQDGILLARHLRAQGHAVMGTALSGEVGTRACYLGDVEIAALDIRDADAFAGIVADYAPDVVHNLAALSSVGMSWSEQEAVDAVNAVAVAGMLEVLLLLGAKAPSFVQASSSEIFGPPSTHLITATTELRPASPYAESKAKAHRAVQKARQEGLHATNLILFGHSSVLHAPHFVLPTIANQAAEVAAGQRQKIDLRDPSVARDWGAAQDYVTAFDIAPQRPPGDFVIATGELHRLSEVASWALSSVDAEAPVEQAADDDRPGDFSGACGDVRPAADVLGWRARTPLSTLVAQMSRVALKRLQTQVLDDPAYLD